jgi:head-tail adaptor
MRCRRAEASARQFAERGLFFTIRYRADVLPEHRILYSQPDTQLDEAYEIIGRPREIGRRQWLKIQVRLVE